MESIKRLRKWWRDKFPLMDKMLGEEFRWHLDEIEHEVEDNERFRREAEPFHDRLCRASERREDVTLWGVDYMPLPVDADGKPIHVGDVMEWVDPDGEVTVTCTVDAVGVGCFFAWDAANCRYAQKCANAYRHHHAPTVEDVLREFAEKITDSQVPGVHPTYEEAIAEYAARLRLAEGVE